MRDVALTYPKKNAKVEPPVVAQYLRAASAPPASRSWADVKHHFGERSGTSDAAFAEHARLVAEIQSDADAALSASDADMGELAALANESGRAVDVELVGLFLRLGPPPDGAGSGDLAPVNSGGGAQE